MKLVHVRWRDAHHIAPGGWINLDDIRPGVLVSSVGIQVRRTKRWLVLAESVDDQGNATGVFAIPRAVIDSVQVVARD